jgi:hypothetical protein
MMDNKPAVYFIVETIRSLGVSDKGGFVTKRAIDIIIANEIVANNIFTQLLLNDRLSAQYRTEDIQTILVNNGTRDEAREMALRLAGKTKND